MTEDPMAHRSVAGPSSDPVTGGFYAQEIPISSKRPTTLRVRLWHFPDSGRLGDSGSRSGHSAGTLLSPSVEAWRSVSGCRSLHRQDWPEPRLDLGEWGLSIMATRSGWRWLEQTAVEAWWAVPGRRSLYEYDHFKSRLDLGERRLLTLEVGARTVLPQLEMEKAFVR